MDLLPKNHEEFRQTEYWDSFFKKRGEKAFEWYGEYGELCGILHKYIKIKDKVLIVGCGNSTLSADLWDVGYKDIVSVDLSDVVIEQMKRKNSDRIGLIFRKMDVTKMDFEGGSFSVVLDKGTLDAMFTNSSERVLRQINEMFSEISRVLRIGGRYICVSLLQPHILKHLVEWFSSHGWPVRIIRCKEAENSRKERTVFPVFVVIATKFRKMPDTPPVLEMALSSEGKLTRLKKSEDLISSVRGIQQFAAIKSSKKKINENVSLDLRAPNSDEPRYSLYLTDRTSSSSSSSSSRLPFAVFIVPQGRETEWLFSTEAGRQQLAESADCQRLVVVHLRRDQIFSSLDKVKEELSGYTMELAPEDLPSNVQVPFLSLSQEDVGERTERCRGKSEISGEFVVEDVSVGNDTYRRLIFLSNPNLTQSEAKIKTVKGKNKKTKKVVDPDYLACTHHSIMIASVGLYLPSERIRCLVVGLGGGALPTFLANKFKQLYVDVVELDPAIVRVAQDQFGFASSDHLKVITEDGLKFIKKFSRETTGDKYTLVLFDVNNKDASVGMSCPPKAFVTQTFLCDVKQCLNKNGMFVLNLVCRDSSLRSEVLTDLHSVFDSVISYRVEEEVNEILFCTTTAAGTKTNDDDIKNHPILEAFKTVNRIVQKENFIEISKALSVLQLV